ncbi:MAG: glutaminyl-peptide cyclotransferase, partial [Smithellaceae bacterium]
GKMPVKYLNELEFICGEIWANVFTTDLIARISPQTGRVLSWIDLSSLPALLPRSSRRDVLNGIAYDPERDRIFVTGKFWPQIFEIKIVK